MNVAPLECCFSIVRSPDSSKENKDLDFNGRYPKDDMLLFFFKNKQRNKIL
jgi:hypothetical protein